MVFISDNRYIWTSNSLIFDPGRVRCTEMYISLEEQKKQDLYNNDMSLLHRRSGKNL